MFKKFFDSAEADPINYQTEYFKLKDEIRELKHEKYELEMELKAIKPVIERKDLEPAMTDNCYRCQYCIRSNYDGSILGCCKNIVCESYKEKENASRNTES